MKSNYIVRKYGEIAIVYSFISGRFFPVKSSLLDDETFVLNDSGLLENRISVNDLDIEIIDSPIVIGIMYSNYCNLNCAYCIAKNGHGYSERNSLSNNQGQLIEKLINSKVLGVLVSGGEPTINETINTFLAKLSDNDLYITLDSNGVKWNSDLFNTISSNSNIIPRISLDSQRKEIHDKNRGGYDNTINTIMSLINQRTPPRINTVLHRDSIDGMKELADFLIQIGIKYWHIYKLQNAFSEDRLYITDEEAESCISSLKQYVGNRIKIFCKFTSNNDGFASFMMDSEGYLFSTQNQTKTKVVFGNVFNHSIEEIWMSTPKDYRQRHINKFLYFK